MAIIQCPSCKAKISDKSKVCSHCNFNFVTGKNTEGLSEEQLASQAKIGRIKQRYSLQMQAMGGLILFLSGIIIWYFVGERGTTQPSHFLQLGAALSGALWYLVTRFRLLLFKKN